MSTATIDHRQLSELIRTSIRQEIAIQNKEWLSRKEAAEHANCSLSKLDQLIDDGEIIAAHRGVKGQTVTVSRKSINDWHSRNAYTPTTWKKVK